MVEKVGVSKSVVDAAGVSGEWVGVSGKSSVSGVSGVAVHSVGISLSLALADVVAGKTGVSSVSGVSNKAGVSSVGGDHGLVAGHRGNNGVVDGPHKRGGKTGVGGSYAAIGVSVQQRISFGFSFGLGFSLTFADVVAGAGVSGKARVSSVSVKAGVSSISCGDRSQNRGSVSESGVRSGVSHSKGGSQTVSGVEVGIGFRLGHSGADQSENYDHGLHICCRTVLVAVSGVEVGIGF